MIPENNIKLPLSMSVIISQKNNNLCLELRKTITNTEAIKSIISCAFHEKPIIIQPKFTDKLRGLNSLIEKGIIYQQENEFYFNI